MPIGYWMHRGCVPFVNPQQFESHYWPTLKPFIEEFWGNGQQTLFYAEGQWKHHLDDFRELPDRSIVFHCDQGEFRGPPQAARQVRHQRRHPERAAELRQAAGGAGVLPRVIKGVAKDGGYIMDAGAIMQDDTSVENMKMMTQVCREHGVYSSGSYKTPTDTPPCDLASSVESRKKVTGMAGRATLRVKPGVCFPWKERAKDLPPITGDKAWSRGSGRISMPWATCTSGRCCCHSKRRYR